MFSDYWDGSLDVPDRDPAGPDHPWFEPIWDRDFPVLKELGVNTIRIYNSNPTTRQSTIDQLGQNGILEPLGKLHIPFMNKAQQYGLKVIFPLMGDEQILRKTPEATVQQMLKNQIDEVGNHSALLMWNFSNEIDIDDNSIAMINRYIRFIRDYTWKKWNR